MPTMEEQSHITKTNCGSGPNQPFFFFFLIKYIYVSLVTLEVGSLKIKLSPTKIIYGSLKQKKKKEAQILQK
jgi:hypothetical protein